MNSAIIVDPSGNLHTQIHQVVGGKPLASTAVVVVAECDQLLVVERYPLTATIPTSAGTPESASLPPKTDGRQEQTCCHLPHNLREMELQIAQETTNKV